MLLSIGYTTHPPLEARKSGDARRLPMRCDAGLSTPRRMRVHRERRALSRPARAGGYRPFGSASPRCRLRPFRVSHGPVCGRGERHDLFGYFVADPPLVDGPTEFKAARRNDPQEELRRAAGHSDHYAFGSSDFGHCRSCAASPPLVTRVLDLRPRIAPTGLVAARRALRHDALKPQAAGVPVHGLAVRTLHVLAVRSRARPSPCTCEARPGARLAHIGGDRHGQRAGGRRHRGTPQPRQSGLGARGSPAGPSGNAPRLRRLERSSGTAGPRRRR